MEHDRYKENHALYIFGIICLLLCLALLLFSAYILPFVLFNYNYDLPYLIFDLRVLIQDRYDISSFMCNVIIWLIFFIPCLISGILAYYISNSIDNRIFKIEPEINSEQEQHLKEQHFLAIQKDIKESTSLGFKIILLMIAIVLAILLVYNLISLY